MNTNKVADPPTGAEVSAAGALFADSLRHAAISTRACFYCGKVLSAHRGFIETVSQPDGERRDFCSRECLHWQLHEDEKL